MLVVDHRHPFLLRAFKREQEGFLSLRIYIWNCTHGGKTRAADEYRVQLTGVVPKQQLDETTLLLGWHDGYGVFVGFDVTKHASQDSASPSIQVKESALLNAHNHAFAAYNRATGEIAVAFRPEFLVEYARNLPKLHGFARAPRNEVAILNSLDTVTDEQIQDEVRDTARREVIASIKRRYREYDFRNRVLSAYAATCAVCGVQLRLVEAAHILPVASDKSTDKTTNGVALCSLHHRAYDQCLVGFNETYRVEVSSAAVTELKTLNLAGGLASFQKGLKNAILLPADKRDYPSPACIRESRKVRGWQP